MSYLTNGCICLILGPLLIGFGGLLTTLGWNEISNYSNRKTLITNAKRELEQNQKYLMDMKNSFEQISKLDKTYLLPTFHYNAIQAIQISPLFSKKDDNLLSATSSYLYNVNPVNNSVLKLNNIFSGTEQSLQDKKNTYINFYSSPLMQKFRQKHEGLNRQLLKLKY